MDNLILRKLEFYVVLLCYYATVVYLGQSPLPILRLEGNRSIQLSKYLQSIHSLTTQNTQINTT